MLNLILQTETKMENYNIAEKKQTGTEKEKLK